MYQKQNNSPDAPSYLRKALERALKEYDQGIIKEKSALEEFADKYVIKGESGVTLFQFFKAKAPQLKDFLRNHRNIKVRFVLVCLMEKIEGNYKLSIFRIKHTITQILILILNQQM